MRLQKGVSILFAVAMVAASACGGSGDGKLTPVQVDRHRVEAMKLHLADFKLGWLQISAGKTSRTCEPDLSGLPPSAGAWDGQSVKFQRDNGVTVQSDAIVLRSASDADLAFLKLTSSAYSDCMVRELRNSNVKGVKFLNVRSVPLQPQPLADDIRSFRVVVSAKPKTGARYNIYIDSLVYRQDRALGRMRFVSLANPGDEDSEWRLAHLTAMRGLVARG
ncbi:MAG: hypothetical protein QOJ13_2896 [Gaiellales bacterium]|nr:hypothetical protein [Gaiellales bacterium]